MGRVPGERVAPVRLGRHDVERRAGRRDRRRRKPGRVDEAPRPVHQKGDQLGRPGDVRPRAAERLAEGTDVHGDPPRQSLRLGEPRAAWPEDAGCVGLVYQEPAVIVLRQCDERREWCPIAVHGED